MLDFRRSQIWHAEACLTFSEKGKLRHNLIFYLMMSMITLPSLFYNNKSVLCRKRWGSEFRASAQRAELEEQSGGYKVTTSGMKSEAVTAGLRLLAGVTNAKFAVTSDSLSVIQKGKHWMTRYFIWVSFLCTDNLCVRFWAFHQEACGVER